MLAKLSLCRKCPHVQPPPYRGRCACMMDGQDIMEHAREGKCPIGRFDELPKGLGLKVPEGFDPKDYELDSKGTGGCGCK